MGNNEFKTTVDLPLACKKYQENIKYVVKNKILFSTNNVKLELLVENTSKNIMIIYLKKPIIFFGSNLQIFELSGQYINYIQLFTIKNYIWNVNG